MFIDCTLKYTTVCSLHICDRILNVWFFDNILNNRFSLVVSLFLTDLCDFGMTICI